MAQQTRATAAARVSARADGSVAKILLAGVETGALEMRRIEHRDACKREATRDASVTMPRFVRRAPEPQLPASEAYGLGLGCE